VRLDLLDGVRPAYRRLRGNPAPLEVYRRLYGPSRQGFLYESLEERGGRGRYSFLGGDPAVEFRCRGDRIRIRSGGESVTRTGDPIEELRRLVRSGASALPVATFPGGAVGYAGYDVVRSLAPLPDPPPDELDLPEMQFVFPREVVIVDHLDEVVHLLHYGHGDPDARADEIAAIVAQEDELEPPVVTPADLGALPEADLRSNMTRSEFAEAVRRAKHHIREGDIFQVVLSQRFEFPVAGSALDLYAALRVTNPSPYMYYLHLDGVEIAGSSPEVLVKLAGRRVVTRPLAGTRPRGSTEKEDRALAEELLADEKERAEHVMLVDLARNDIGRVCRPGTVRLQRYLEIERYARVMHLVSDVEGRLRDDRDAFDLFRATFPAGTVSGAPKVRAMQIIDDLEPVRRGPYAGAIGYFSFLGDMDLCIAIRSIVVRNGRGYLQAGAGIVADSSPEREYQETLNKARGLVRALRLAGVSG
jgi:anthranilate synthase component 1